MFNKNLIVGLVAIVLLGGGIVFYFLNGNNMTAIPSPISTKGELTRELAHQIIIDYYAKEMEKPMTIPAIYLDATDAYIMSDVYGDRLNQLITKGLVTRRNSTDSFYFTNAATPYLSESGSPNYPNNKTVKLGDYKMKNMTVTGITTPTETTALVSVTVEGEYTYTPFGEVLSEKGLSKEPRIMTVPFTLYDDGWRVKSF